ncbi:hypothetical protein C2845_PM16G08260 [Panicum miliaceum]|uniref:F-box domain-containing protein n=1 Tax=Panicum miliaceum TaxID=4540 RepID=A0A3L6PX40_PANMI|nr:hypothetical protein C2845_PM16G08260 [Panicum miliaceum]
MDMETPAASRDGGRLRVAADRLSALPDHVLLNVLSCLSSLQAARTSALLRRWRHLWRAVLCIDIDQSEFLRPPRPAAAELRPTRVHADAAKEEHERLLASIELRDRFEDLGDRLSLRHDASSPPLDALRLRVACDDFRAALEWIRRGLARRPAALFLRCDNDNPEDKDRRWPCIPTAYAAGTFTSLRTLRLSGLSLTSNFADDLAAGFPVLEDVRRAGPHGTQPRFAARLWRCAADHLAMLDAVRRRGDADAPGRRPRRPEVPAQREEPEAVRLLDDGEPGGFPVFGSLRTLLLDGCDVGAGCHVLRRFLGSAPGLETLTLRSCLRNRAFSGGGAPTSRSGKRKASAKRKRPDDQRAPAAYPCTNLKLIELEFEEDHALFELAGALRDISKEVVRPIEGSVQDGRRTVKIKYT